mgnify:CR=1 FL=1
MSQTFKWKNSIGFPNVNVIYAYMVFGTVVFLGIIIGHLLNIFSKWLNKKVVFHKKTRKNLV